MATPTSWRSTATCSISRIACWSSSPMAISRRPSRGSCCSRPGSTCCYSDLTESPRQVPARIRGQGGQGSRLSPRTGQRLDHPARRRHRGERAADGRGARLVLALRARIVRGRRLPGRDDRARRPCPTRALSRPNIMMRSRRCWPRRGLQLPPDQRPILGGRRGHHSEHLGHLLAVMQHLPRTYPDAKW